MEKGPSKAIRFPAESPYDARLGYSHMPAFLTKLQSRDYVIDSQARMSPKMLELADRGLFATYREKTRTGLEILDCRSQPLFASRFPERFYERFDDTPQLLVQSLLFIENRELLDPAYPKRNPAIEWDRFSKAVFDKSLHAIGIGSGGRVAGGSHAGHADRKIPPLARRPHRLAAATSSSRWPRPRCAPTRTAKTPPAHGARSCSTT